MILLAFSVMTGVPACSPKDPTPTPETPQQPENPNGGNNAGESDDNMKLKIKVGAVTFTATLADNAAAKAFKALLPMTVMMTEHAGNEKYYDLSNALTTAASNPGTIHNGDIMLYGSRMVVLFYKTFSTSYSYTRIGKVDDPTALEAALGAGNVSIAFDMAVSTANLLPIGFLQPPNQ